MGIKIKKAVIPVAGLGTRMLPATKAIPKELLPVYDSPVIEYVVKEAIAGGIEEIIFVTRSGKEAIENHFDVNYELEHRLEKKGKKNILGSVKNIIPESVRITSIRQPDALGLGHAVLCARHLLNDEPFAVLLPDVIVLDKLDRKSNFSFNCLIDAWDKTGVGQIMVERVKPSEVENYGVIDLGSQRSQPFINNSILDLIEKPSQRDAPSDLAIVGRYILPASVLDVLERIPVGVGGEIQLTDALQSLIDTDGLNSLETDASIFDCGNKIGFIGANLAVSMRDPAAKKYLRLLFENGASK